MLLEQLVGRVDLPAEVVRDDDGREDDAREHVPEDHLDEPEVAAVGERRHADDGQRARLRSDDGNAGAPPRHVAAAEEVVAGVVLVLAEP